MPKGWQGIEEDPHVQKSEVVGGGKPKENRDGGFEGKSEKNLERSEADKPASRKGHKE